MAKNRGWWSLNLSCNTMDELSDADKEHIGEQIKKDFTSGDVCQDEEE